MIEALWQNVSVLGKKVLFSFEVSTVSNETTNKYGDLIHIFDTKSRVLLKFLKFMSDF